MLTDSRLNLKNLSWTPCYFTEFLYHYIDTFSIILTLILSVDRFYAVIKPFDIKFFLTYRQPKKIVILIALTILILLSPRLILNEDRFSETS